MAPVPQLGVGVAYQPALTEFLLDNRDAYDYVEVVPDTVWSDRGRRHTHRYSDDREAIAVLDELASDRTIVPHSIGLSIGSAHLFDEEHVEQVRQWCERFDCPWHSDHLSYNRVLHGDEMEVNAGMTVPLTLDNESLDLLIPRVMRVQERNSRPFALENNVYYMRLEGDHQEPEFLNELAARTGCWLLLDLHNIYVNERNGGMPTQTFLERVSLDRVIEIHVAGGTQHGSFYLDSHAGATPAPVLDLLAEVLPSCVNLGGITFELVGSWFETFGADGLAGELERLRELWAQSYT